MYVLPVLLQILMSVAVTMEDVSTHVQTLWVVTHVPATQVIH